MFLILLKQLLASVFFDAKIFEASTNQENTRDSGPDTKKDRPCVNQSEFRMQECHIINTHTHIHSAPGNAHAHAHAYLCGPVPD